MSLHATSQQYFCFHPCLVVEECDVSLLPEALEGAGVVCVGVAVRAAHPGRVGAAQLAKLVRVVPQGVVPWNNIEVM